MLQHLFLGVTDKIVNILQFFFSPAGPLTGSTLTATAAGGTIASSFSTFPSTGASVTSFEVTTASALNNAGQWTTLQYEQQQPLFTAAASQPSIQQATPPVGAALNNQVCLILCDCLKCSLIIQTWYLFTFLGNFLQPWVVPSVPSVQGHPSTSIPHASHLVPKPANDAMSSVALQPSAVDMKPRGRSELPEVFFTPYFTS